MKYIGSFGDSSVFADTSLDKKSVEVYMKSGCEDLKKVLNIPFNGRIGFTKEEVMKITIGMLVEEM